MIELRLREFLIKGLSGDEHAYREFLDLLSGYLRSFLKRRLSRFPDEVEDVVQEALLAIHNKRYSYDCNQPFAAWISAIAKYKLIDFLRRRDNENFLTSSLDDESDIFLATNMDAAEAQRDLMKLLNQLPERQRLPIVHTKLNGFSVEETSEITGMSVSAIKVGVHRGLKALAARIMVSRENK